MAKTLEVGQILEAKFYCAAGLQGAQNVRYWKVAAVTGGGVTDKHAADRLVVLMKPLYVALLSTAAIFRGATVKIIEPIEYDAEGTQDPGAGTVAGDILPTEISFVANFKSGLAGRMHRNRVYIPFPGEADNDPNGIPTAGYLTRAGALAAQLGGNIVVTSGVNTADLTAVIYPGNNPATGEVVSQAAIGTLWSSLDSRSARSSQNPNPFS